MAHGWVALKLGDSTARDLGRLTLNPIPHIDFFGSILVPLFSVLATGRVFIAWAKPVPIDPRNFSNFKRDDTFVTVAGPLSNLIVAFLCAMLAVLFYYIVIMTNPSQNSIGFEFLNFMFKMFYSGILLNVSLAVFNMLPIPPLDGSHVVANILPDEAAFRFRRIGFMGIFLILILFNYIPGFTQFFITIITAVSKPYFSIVNHFMK
jgi:Zn-dependent protease